ncbi:ATP-binding protein [Streptomyces sp. NPDC088725]|uniref:ATP-binding protein n=1 Tax=Streptomyces sp. NPDC088725 TaxID=3365873 RepID=UPI00381B3D33
MVRVAAPPDDQTSPAVRALVFPAVLIVAVTACVVAVVPDAARIPVALYGGVATAVITWCAAELAGRGREVSTLHEHYAHRVAFLERRFAERDDETVRLGRELMPAALRRLRQGQSPAEAMSDVVDGDERHRELGPALRALLRDVLENAAGEEAERVSARRSSVTIAQRVQSLVHQQAGELRQMEEAHGRNPLFFDDLLRIDHGTALIGRLADSLALLGHARPDRQWPMPVPLFSVMRGAMSRILEYQRVDLHSIAKVAVTGTAVEPVIHACAELLDNATRCSPPGTRVHVTAVEVQTGIAIEIEDGGPGLGEEARERAERTLARALAGQDPDDPGESPGLGMAVVGRLCRLYQLRFSLRQSAYGGVRAVLVVPHDLITTGPAPGVAHGIGVCALPGADAAPPRTPHVAEGVGARAEDDVPLVMEWTENGLPQRRARTRTERAGHHDAASTPGSGRKADKAPVRESGPGLWLEAFTKAVNGPSRESSAARKDTPAGSGCHDETDNARGKGEQK